MALRRPRDAEAAVARLESETSGRWKFGLAVAYAALGRKALAFDWLDRAHLAKDSSLWAIKGHPFFKSLESAPATRCSYARSPCRSECLTRRRAAQPRERVRGRGQGPVRIRPGNFGLR